ncbi:hypothetical protein M0R45_009845 [Rubus argutus]|uniref:Uncharacterized protein n=1 Tax=Rubus argutus TaxID=59490 RepID=A0AAW1Y6A7_RUBAR
MPVGNNGSPASLMVDWMNGFGAGGADGGATVVDNRGSDGLAEVSEGRGATPTDWMGAGEIGLATARRRDDVVLGWFGDRGDVHGDDGCD